MAKFVVRFWWPFAAAEPPAMRALAADGLELAKLQARMLFVSIALDDAPEGYQVFADGVEVYRYPEPTKH